MADRWWTLMARWTEASARKRTVEVSVKTDRDAYCPGDQVSASIRIESKESLAIRAASAELVCLITYSPLTLWPNYHRMPLTHARTRRALLGNGHLSPGQRETFNVTFQVPENALPTHRGLGIFTQWWIQAGVDAPSAKGPFHRLVLLLGHVPWGQQTCLGPAPMGLAGERRFGRPRPYPGLQAGPHRASASRGQ